MPCACQPGLLPPAFMIHALVLFHCTSPSETLAACIDHLLGLEVDFASSRSKLL